tara:strand:+ start:309 stop:497 length:189 start_codon:yes stop_codon:yes gene_type:complete
MTEFTNTFALVTAIAVCVVGFFGSIKYHYGDKAMLETIAAIGVVVIAFGLWAIMAVSFLGKP